LKGIINRKLENISDFPDNGTSISAFTDNFAEKFANIQRVLAKNYLIIYEHHKEEKIAIVVNVFHQAQDYAQVFQ